MDTSVFLFIFYLRPGTDDDRLLQLLNADDSDFEGDSKDDHLYQEVIVEEDFDLGQVQEKKLLVNTIEKIQEQ